MKPKLKYILIITAAILFSINIYAEKPKGAVRVRAFIEFDRKPVEFAQVDVYVDSKKIESFTTNVKGEFKLFLDLDKEYIINVSKSGLVSKKVRISTHIPAKESGIWFYEFFLDLFRYVPGLDLSPLEKPVTQIAYNTKSGMFVHDSEYTLAMKGELEKVIHQQIALRKLASKD